MKDFLKPEWKKFILPIILIVLFLVVINAFYYAGSVVNKYGCDGVSLTQESQKYISENNTIAYNQTVNSLDSLIENMQKGAKPVHEIQPLFDFIVSINPFTPVSCEFSMEKSCEYYMNKETYNCFMSLSTNADMSGTFPIFELREYSDSIFFRIVVSVFVLFIEGYLLSSIVLFLYRMIKRKKRSPPATSSSPK